MDWYTLNKIKFQAESVEQQNSWCGLCGCEGGCNLCDPVKELESDHWQAILIQDFGEDIKILSKVFGKTRGEVENFVKELYEAMFKDLDPHPQLIIRSPEIKRPQYIIVPFIFK